MNFQKKNYGSLEGSPPLQTQKKIIDAYLSKKGELKKLLHLPYKEAKALANSYLTNDPKSEEIDQLYKKSFNGLKRKATPITTNRKEVLENLKKEGLKLGIVTDAGKGSIYRDLEEEINLFDVIITGEDIQTPKPSPEGIIRALNKLKTDPKNALFVGDTEVDALAAERAGVRFVGVETGMMTKKWWAELGYEVVESVEDLAGMLSHL